MLPQKRKLQHQQQLSYDCGQFPNCFNQQQCDTGRHKRLKISSLDFGENFDILQFIDSVYDDYNNNNSNNNLVVVPDSTTTTTTNTTTSTVLPSSDGNNNHEDNGDDDMMIMHSTCGVGDNSVLDICSFTTNGTNNNNNNNNNNNTNSHHTLMTNEQQQQQQLLPSDQGGNNKTDFTTALLHQLNSATCTGQLSNTPSSPIFSFYNSLLDHHTPHWAEQQSVHSTTTTEDVSDEDDEVVAAHKMNAHLVNQYNHTTAAAAMLEYGTPSPGISTPGPYQKSTTPPHTPTPPIASSSDLSIGNTINTSQINTVASSSSSSSSSTSQQQHQENILTEEGQEKLKRKEELEKKLAALKKRHAQLNSQVMKYRTKPNPQTDAIFRDVYYNYFNSLLPESHPQQQKDQSPSPSTATTTTTTTTTTITTTIAETSKTTGQIGIILANGQNHIVFMNQVMLDKLGYTAEEANSGKLTWSDVLHPLGISRMMAWCINNIIERKNSSTIENILFKRRGIDTDSPESIVRASKEMIWYSYDTDSTGRLDKLISDSRLFF